MCAIRTRYVAFMFRILNGGPEIRIISQSHNWPNTICKPQTAAHLKLCITLKFQQHAISAVNSVSVSHYTVGLYSVPL
jgi:hypothetical protein